MIWFLVIIIIILICAFKIHIALGIVVLCMYFGIFYLLLTVAKGMEENDNTDFLRSKDVRYERYENIEE